MCQKILTKYLIHQINAKPASRTCYTVELRQTVAWLMKEYKHETETKRLEYIEILCTAATTIFEPHLLFRRMIVKFASEPVHSFHEASLLTALAYLSDISKLKILIDAGVDVNEESQLMGKPLQAAVAGGHIEITILLLKCGANVDWKNNEGKHTALQLAGRAGHETIVRLLLDSTCDSPEIDHEKTMLSFVRSDNVDLMQLMIKTFQIEQSDRFKSAILHEASTYGAVNVVRMMFNEGADVNSRDFQWRTAIQKAASRGYGETVQFLITKGARYDAGISSPIHQAVKHGYERVVQILLDAGDNIDREDNGGLLTIAVKYEKFHMIQYLFDKGISPHAKSAQTALNVAAERGYERIVRMLMIYGIDVDNENHRPMLSALMFGHDNVVKTLLEFGAQKIDVSECQYAAEFASGAYPIRRPFRY